MSTWYACNIETDNPTGIAHAIGFAVANDDSYWHTPTTRHPYNEPHTANVDLLVDDFTNDSTETQAAIADTLQLLDDIDAPYETIVTVAANDTTDSATVAVYTGQTATSRTRYTGAIRHHDGTRVVYPYNSNSRDVNRNRKILDEIADTYGIRPSLGGNYR